MYGKMQECAHWNHSFDVHLNYLGPVSYVSSWLTVGSGCSLMAARWQVFFFFLSSLRVHQLSLCWKLAPGVAYQQEFSPDLGWVSQSCGTKIGHEMSPKYWSNLGPRGGTDKWSIASHISKQRMSQSSAIARVFLISFTVVNFFSLLETPPCDPFWIAHFLPSRVGFSLLCIICELMAVLWHSCLHVTFPSRLWIFFN